MGCDGGTIPKRDEMVRKKQQPEQKDRNAELSAKWKYCSISQEPLNLPIVSCELGRLYNKEKLIEFLLDRTKFEAHSNFSHIRALKDVKELNLTVNPDKKDSKSENKETYSDIADYICPVTGLEMNGRHDFCFIWSCGCAFSDRAHKELKSTVCHVCGKMFETDNIILLNPNAEEFEKLKLLMKQRREKIKLNKKALKRKLEVPIPSCSTKTAVKTVHPRESDSTKVLTECKTSVSDLKPKSKSDVKGKAIMVSVDNSKQSNDGSSGIQKDPSVTSAYKSLFTTCKAAKNQTPSHWVTYNPMYY